MFTLEILFEKWPLPLLDFPDKYLTSIPTRRVLFLFSVPEFAGAILISPDN
jgi:hypothetical protein